MKVTATYRGKMQKIELKDGSTVQELLDRMDINRETVLIGRGKDIVPETERLKDKDAIEVIRVISGG